MRTVRLLISGRVQGVGYREWARRQALALGLDGWVRNLRDGCVEAVAQGEDAAVAELIERANRGPSSARVQHIDVSDGELASASGFEVRRTA
jgi:acylphosphatase